MANKTKNKKSAKFVLGFSQKPSLYLITQSIKLLSYFFNNKLISFLFYVR